MLLPGNASATSRRERDESIPPEKAVKWWTTEGGERVVSFWRRESTLERIIIVAGDVNLVG